MLTGPFPSGLYLLMRRRDADGSSVLLPQAEAAFAYLDDEGAAGAQNAKVHAGHHAQLAQAAGQARRTYDFLDDAFYARAPRR